MRVLSCFDGISACQQAFKNLGVEFDGVNNQYFASEIDKFAIKATQHNFPNTIQLGDVKGLKILHDLQEPISYCSGININKDGFSFQCQDIDLLVAGFPCQSFSIAGNRKGFEDDRGNLFFELLRIIKEVKPKYFLLENVNSMSKENKEIICDKLGIDFVMINSSLLTAQQRKRIYFVAELQQDGTYKKVEISQPQDKGILLKDIIEEDVDEKYWISEKHQQAMQKCNKNFKTRELDGKTTTLTAGYYKQPQDGNYLLIGGRCVVNTKETKITRVSTKATTLCARDYKGFGGKQDGNCVIATQINNSHNFGNATSDKGKAFTLRASQPNGVIVENRIRKLTEIECCKLQGFPVDYFLDKNGEKIISTSQQYKALGNSFTVPVIEHILKHLFSF